MSWLASVRQLVQRCVCMNSGAIVALITLSILIVVGVGLPTTFALTNDSEAIVVVGQHDSRANGVNRAQVSADSLFTPSGVFVAVGGIYIADENNHRALFYPNNSISATVAYGQPNLTTNQPNNNGTADLDGPPQMTTLLAPSAIVAVSSGVYVADTGNHRVLFFPSGSTAATRVYGQPDFASGQPNRSMSTPSASSLFTPSGLAVAADGLYVADTGNHRVLFFPSGSTAATRVYGQPDFVSGQPNATPGIPGTPSASSLSEPHGIAVAADGLYVADTGNHRVLFFPSGSTAATRVYGQPDFASGQPNATLGIPGTPSASSLSGPQGIAVAADGLYVADTGNHRVLFFPSGSTAATRVYGQPDFVAARSSAATGMPSARSLTTPRDVAVDAQGLYIADSGNNRVLFFAGFDDTAADRVYGQSDSTQVLANRAVLDATGLSAPSDITAADDGLYMADTGNHRVLFFPSGSTAATRVYGQPDFASGQPNTTPGRPGTPSASSLSEPYGIAVAADGLYVADTGNHRVLFFPSGSTAATRVYGQPDFASGQPNRSTSTPSASSLFTPSGLAVAADGLYVADAGNHRVLFFPSGSTAATRVYGQPDFASGQPNATPGTPGTPSARSLAEPRDVVVEDGGLYIADASNHRVLYYDGFSDVDADRVYGQPTFTFSIPNNNGSNLLGTPLPSNLQFPTSVASDEHGVYIADGGNYRVLFFSGSATTATVVYGQRLLTSGTPNDGAMSGQTTATSLNAVNGITVDGAGQLYVADTNNNRGLVISSAGAVATLTQAGGTVAFNSSGVQLLVPEYALTTTTQFRFNELPKPGEDLPAQAVFAFRLAAEQGTVSLDRLERPYTMTLSYDGRGLVGVDEARLNLARFDNVRKVWAPLLPCNNCSVDSVRNSVTIVLHTLGDFALVSNFGYDSYLPLTIGPYPP